MFGGAAWSTTLILLFAKKFFRALHTRARMSWTGQIFWLLAYDACAARTFFPPSPPKPFRDWPIGKLYPVTAAQLLPIRTGFLAPIHFSSSQRTGSRTSCLRSALQDLFSARPQTAGLVRQWSYRPPAFLLGRRKLERSRRVFLSQ